MFKLLGVLILACTTAAQLPVLKTKSVIGLTIDRKSQPNNQPVRHYQWMPANTKIDGRQVVSLKVGSSGYDTASASTIVQAFYGTKASSFTFEEIGSISSTFNTSTYEISTSTATRRQGHEWILSVPARAAGNRLSMTGASATMNSYPPGKHSHHNIIAIDIGNDGSYEVLHDTKSGPLVRLFQLGTKAIDVRIATYGQVAWTSHATYGLLLGMTLNPRAALKFKSYGATCGMSLTGSDRLDDFGHHFTMTALGGFAGQPILFEIGLQKAKIPLFPGTCSLSLIPLIIIPRTANSVGAAAFSNINPFYPLPAGPFGAFFVPDNLSGKFYVQAVAVYSSLGLTSYRTSNGLEVDAGK